MSGTEKDAIGDGVCHMEKPGPGGVEHPETSENAAERTAEDTSTSKERAVDYSDPVFKTLSRINGEINRMHKEELRNKLAELHLNTGGVKEVLKKRLKNYYKRKKLAAANMAKGVEKVPYEFLVVIDFEATCQENNDRFIHEIIEFPAVLIQVEQREIIGMFREFCKPVINPALTGFCKELTGINQSDVDMASEFPKVLEHFEKWLGNRGLGTSHTFCVVTDGPWDIHRFLSQQCDISQMAPPAWSRRWINVRKAYGNYYDTHRLSLGLMLDNLGLRFQGRPHCGLDDARNIARIVCHMLDDGCILRANERLDHHCRGAQPAAAPSSSSKTSSLPKGDGANAHTHLGACSPSAGLGSEAAGKNKRCTAAAAAVREAEESEEDVSDLLYYFSLQSA